MNTFHNKISHNNFFAILVSSLMLLSLYPASSQAVAICGPGDHWVDNCAAGTDTAGTISGVFAIDFIGLGQFIIPVEGTMASIIRSNPIDTFDSLDPGHNNQIITELVSATMENIETIPGAGNFTVRLGTGSGVSTSSIGAINELADVGMANSYFDIFFEVDSALGVFHNIDPIRISAVIDEWDPDAGVFYQIDQSFGLPEVYNSGGLVVANTLFIEGVTGFTLGATAVPVPAALYLFLTGLLGFVGVARRNKQQ